MSLVTALAETLAMGRMRDEPSAKDWNDAEVMADGIQSRRIAAGLKPLTGEEGRIVKRIDVDAGEED